MATATFTNIARTPNAFSGSGSGASISILNDSNLLYSGGTLSMYSTSTGTECYTNVSNFITSGINISHKYYACFWAKSSVTGKSVDLYVGSSIDSEADRIASGSVGTGWTRISGVATLSDSGGVKARIDFNNAGTRYIYCYFSGFLFVDLTNAGLASKSKEWCDDHLYYVSTSSSASITYYDYEGTRANSYVSGSPTVANLVTYHNLAANKSNRGGTTIGSAGSQSSATWASGVIATQNANKSKGTNYGTCGVNKITPSQWTSNSVPSKNSTTYYTSGRTLINNLIRNADALYGQIYCVQNTLTYSNSYCACDNDCCDSDCSCDYNKYPCTCDGNCCDSYYECIDCSGDCACDEDGYCCYTYAYCSRNREYGCSFDCHCDSNYSCDCDTVCSCNNVCSCNWV